MCAYLNKSMCLHCMHIFMHITKGDTKEDFSLVFIIKAFKKALESQTDWIGDSKVIRH